MLENRRVIAVDQDPLGIQGTVVNHEGSGQVWSKPLKHGDVAIALLNRGSQAMRITTTAGEAGLRSARSYRVRDLWSGATSGTTGAISAEVPPDSVVLYRVKPVPA
jgi:alpha-galactosidase